MFQTQVEGAESRYDKRKFGLALANLQPDLGSFWSRLKIINLNFVLYNN